MKTKIITLSAGKYAVVDESDYGWLSLHKWSLCNGYAVRTEGPAVKRKCIYMHREITKAAIGLDVDHVDHDRLNNTRANLRVCSHVDNIRSQSKRVDNTSGFRGVSHRKDTGKWSAYIHEHGLKISLGCFKTAAEAAKAYDKAAKKLYGSFAVLNNKEAKEDADD